MKRIVLIMTICLGLISSSCSDWLDILPNNEQVTDKYWKSKEDVEAVLASGYYYMRTAVPVMLRWGELRGGTLYTMSSRAGLFGGDEVRLQNFDILPNNKAVRYNTFYKIINIANSVLYYAEDVRATDETYSEAAWKAHLTEAYFMRAFSYFMLVRNYRDVPLVLNAYVNDDVAYSIAKSDEKTILNQIKEDIKSALETKAAKETYEEEWQTKGRATKWALYALMADVCLWNEDYTECIQYCNYLLDANSRFRPVFMSDPTKWAEIFYPGLSNESILELYCNNNLGQLNNQEYNQKDELKTSGEGQFGMFLLGMNSPLSFTETAVMKWTEETQNVFENPEYLNMTLERAGRSLLATYAYSTLTTVDAGKQTYQTQGNSYFLYKYWIGEQANYASSNTRLRDSNFILYRMAEIILMKAEALVMSGTVGSEEWSAAIDLINQVHTRAMLPPLELVSAETDEFTLLQTILDEREMEFAGEGKRWYDLLRLAKKDNWSNTNYKEFVVATILERNNTQADQWIQSVLRSNDAFYLPLPQDDIDNNPLLEQNPYYAN